MFQRRMSRSAKRGSPAIERLQGSNIPSIDRLLHVRVEFRSPGISGVFHAQFILVKIVHQFRCR